MTSSNPGFALYIHWPFCLSKCPYCDFNSHVREGVDHAAWRKALLTELAHYAALTPGRTLTSIFFGGGTPSLMEPATVSALIEAVAQYWKADDNLEITLEANPTSVEAGRFAAYRSAGVNRVSLGVQALEDAPLKFLGRGHSAAEALAAVELAARHFPRFSFDLIYARPGQSVTAWEVELRRALDYAGEHLSLYQLTIEQGTAFHTLHQRGDLAVPPEEDAADLYEATQSLLTKAGLPAYEISNHAKPGAESRHNLTYWRYGDYIGIGPGAHGRLNLPEGRMATRTHRAPEAWLERVTAQGHGAEPFTPITQEEALSELLMMGLRLAEGMPVERIEAIGGAPFPALLNPQSLERLIKGGFLTLTPTRLTATMAGRQRLNAVLGALFL